MGCQLEIASATLVEGGSLRLGGFLSVGVLRAPGSEVLEANQVVPGKPSLLVASLQGNRLIPMIILGKLS